MNIDVCKKLKLIKIAGKFDDKQHYKAIIEASTVYTSDRIIYNNPISPGSYMTVKKSSASKSLHQFLEALDFKQDTAICMLGSDKSKRKVII